MAATGKPRVFLSYGSQDGLDAAHQLAADLGAKYDVWCDWDNILAGEPWMLRLQEGIGSSRLVIFLESRYSTRGGDAPGDPCSICQNEINEARKQSKQVLPVMLDENAGLLLVNHLHFVDLCNWKDKDAYRKGLNELILGIENVLAGGRVPLRTDIANAHELKDSFEGFAAARRVNFFGRDWLFAKIEEWLTRESSAFVLIGEPGIGKSAFVSEFINRNPGKRILAYHYCRFNDRKTLLAGMFVRSVAFMATERFDSYARQVGSPDSTYYLSEQNCDADPAHAFEMGFLRPLRGMTPPDDAEGHVCFLIIDALDECLASGSTPSSQAQTSPGQGIVDLIANCGDLLPQWLRLIVTTRPGKAAESLKKLMPCEIQAEGQANRNDVQLYIENRLRAEKIKNNLAGNQTPEQLAPILAAKAGGLFLYAKTVLNELENRGRTLAELEALPDTLPGLFADFFQRQFPDPGSAGSAWPDAKRLLEVVIAAHEPLTSDQLLRTLDTAQHMDRGDLDQLLQDLEAYLPDDNQRIRVFHKSFSEWLVAARPPFYIDLSNGEKALAGFAWAEYNVWRNARRPLTISDQGGFSPYVLAYGVEHLLEADRFADAVELLDFLRRPSFKETFSPQQQLALERSSKRISIYLATCTPQQQTSAANVDPFRLAALLKTFYEIEPLSGGIGLLYNYHREAWPKILEDFLHSDDYVIRYAVSDILADAYSSDGSGETLKQIRTYFNDRDNINYRELGAYALSSVYAKDAESIEPADLQAMAESKTYPQRSALGDLLLNLALQGKDRSALVSGERFWNPIWDYNKLDIWDLKAILASVSKPPQLPGDAPQIQDAYSALTLVEKDRKELLSSFDPEQGVGALLENYDSLGTDTAQIRGAQDAFKSLDQETLARVMRILLAHPFWDVSEAAASVLSSIAETRPEALDVIAECLGASQNPDGHLRFQEPARWPHWKLRYGAIEAAFGARSLPQRNTLFEDAVHQFYGDSNCRIRALCAENLIAWILSSALTEKQRKLEGFEKEIARWLIDEDCWVLEHVYRLFHNLEPSERDGLLAKGVSRLFEQPANEPAWYDLHREQFLELMERNKTRLVEPLASATQVSS